MFYGDSPQYQLTKLTDIITNDRVMNTTQDISLSPRVNLLYKAFTIALDHKLFRLNGPYECANEYISMHLSQNHFDALPVIEADTFYPYIFKHQRTVRGVVTFDEVMQDNDEQRRIICVNVMRTGSLVYFIPNPKIIYLGGPNHHPGLSLNTSSHTIAKIEPEELPWRRAPLPEYLIGVTQRYSCLRISSPFKTTWTYKSTGPNVGIATCSHGHYLYWATSDIPSSGAAVCEVNVSCIPIEAFRSVCRLCRLSGVAEDIDDSKYGNCVFERAWLMRGHFLSEQDASLFGDAMPTGVVARLRGGFFLVPAYREVEADIPSISRQVCKTIRDICKSGCVKFGFTEEEGVVKCRLGPLSKALGISVEILLAYFARFSSIEQYFRGTISLLCKWEAKGILDVCEPLPVGKWMTGRIVETGAGLLYVVESGKYLCVETKGDVSEVCKYNGDGVVERSEVCLGKKLELYQEHY